jgi:hypothetical protein
MNVRMTFEDVVESCNAGPCSMEEFIAMIKQFIFRRQTFSHQGTYMVFYRGPTGPVGHLHTVAQVESLLGQIKVAIIKLTNGASVVSHHILTKKVDFDPYIE